MVDETDADGVGALSVDAAVGLLDGAPASGRPSGRENDSARTQDEEGLSFAATSAGNLPTPDAQDFVDQSDEESGPQASDAEAAAVEAPLGWDADARARFAELPRGLQDYLSRREGERDQAVSFAQREAAEARQQANGELAMVQQLSDQLAEVLPQVLATHQDRWGDNPDWHAVADELGTDEAFRLKTQWERERAQVAQLARHRAEADRMAHAAFVADELEKLKTVAPALADPREGAERRAAMGRYLMEQGASAEQLRHLGALEAAIAWKAMQWDQAQAGLKAGAGPNASAAPPRAAPRPNVRVGASAPIASAQRSAETLARRLSQTGSVDDAVALLNARKRA